MKRIINILIFLLLYQFSYAQVSVGNYSNHSDFFRISNDSVCFELTTYGCFFTHIRGCGFYDMIDDFLFIETTDFHGDKSTFQKSLGKSGQTEFLITDSDSDALAGVTIVFEDSLGNTVHGTVTNKEGQAIFEHQTNIEQARISFLGCDEVDFSFEPGYDYQIKLVEGNISEHQTVVYEIISVKSNSIELALIDANFRTTKDTLKTLKRIRRKNRKHNHSTNKLEKADTSIGL